jgi:pimeloyl-ACP methyl ester carboxylesterase
MQERTLILGDERHLVATLTELPAGSPPPPCVVILTNSGVIPRTGPHRMNVHLARQFADMGIPSIRFDLSGLGDSLRHSSPRPVMDQWVADTRAVMDLAERHFHCPRFAMIGFCSGAEVAHLVALEDPRMRAALLWDLYAYPTLLSRLHTIAYRMQRAGALGLLRKSIGRAEAIVGRLLGRQVSSPRPKPPSAVPSSVPPKEQFAKRIQTLVDQGVELLFAYALQPEWFNHPGQFRQMFRGWPFAGQVAFRHLDRCDHLLTQRSSQTAFSHMVMDWMQHRVLPSLRR